MGLCLTDWVRSQGDASPTLLQNLQQFVLGPAWQRYNATLEGVNGTINLLPREAGVSWLSEVSLVKLAAA